MLDIGLPGIDGYELARRLRADARLADVRLIALTGYGRETDRARTLASSFDEHLVKPVSPERLFEAVERQLARPKRTAFEVSAARARHARRRLCGNRYRSA